jgi:hypothetical protein
VSSEPVGTLGDSGGDDDGGVGNGDIGDGTAPPQPQRQRAVLNTVGAVLVAGAPRATAVRPVRRGGGAARLALLCRLRRLVVRPMPRAARQVGEERGARRRNTGRTCGRKRALSDQASVHVPVHVQFHVAVAVAMAMAVVGINRPGVRPCSTLWQQPDGEAVAASWLCWHSSTMVTKRHRSYAITYSNTATLQRHSNIATPDEHFSTTSYQQHLSNTATSATQHSTACVRALQLCGPVANNRSSRQLEP